MKKLLSLLLLPLILFSSCDFRAHNNIFSGLKNMDNITVLEAIASGDEQIMKAVYEREKALLASLSRVEDREIYNEIRLNIADLQSVRSRAVLVFLVLIAVEVAQYEVSEVIDQQVVEDFIYEVAEQVMAVVENLGDPTSSQKLMAVLGIIVWWYYVSVDIGTTPAEMIRQYKAGTLEEHLLSLNWSGEGEYGTQIELETALEEDVDDMEAMVLSIQEDPDLSASPELEQALNNVISLYGLGE